MTWTRVKKYVKVFFSDKHGNVVIWQMPNLPLILWFVFMLAAYTTHGQIRAVLAVASTASLLVWAFLEIVQGASYFRRVLGMIVFIATVYSRLQ